MAVTPHVAVVGAGHVAGMTRAIEQHEQIDLGKAVEGDEGERRDDAAGEVELVRAPEVHAAGGVEDEGYLGVGWGGGGGGRGVEGDEG